VIRFAADENFNNDILRAAWRVEPTLDIIRVQDTEASGFSDPNLLRWLTKENRILLTHDVNTVPGFAKELLKEGFSLPGIFLVHDSKPVAAVAQDILLVASCSSPEEWVNQLWYLPFS
jgi:Domain of unknown function (DUF5615)